MKDERRIIRKNPSRMQKNTMTLIRKNHPWLTGFYFLNSKMLVGFFLSVVSRQLGNCRLRSEGEERKGTVFIESNRLIAPTPTPTTLTLPFQSRIRWWCLSVCLCERGENGADRVALLPLSLSSSLSHERERERVRVNQLDIIQW